MSDLRPRHLLLILLLALPSPGRAAPPSTATVTTVVDAADVVYEASFRFNCSLPLWLALVEDPVLFADLWNAYGYGPAYQVSLQRQGIHVVDPTGLVGDVTPLETALTRRRWFVHGQLDHWAVPFLNEGLAVFTLALHPDREGLGGELVVHVKASTEVAGFLLRLGRPLLLSHVANRIELNLRDAGQLLESLEHRPEEVRQKLNEDLWQRLQKVLSATQ